jgi:hypothetical protein
LLHGAGAATAASSKSRPAEAAIGAARGTPARRSCFAQVATAGRSLRFSNAPAGPDGSVSLTIRRFQHPILIAQASACSPSVLVGHTYRASLRYRSSTGALSLEVLSHRHGAWSVSRVAQHLKASKGYTTASVVIGPIAGGVDRVDVGLLLRAAGTVRATGFTLTDISASPAAPHLGSAPAAPAAPTPTPTPAPTPGPGEETPPSGPAVTGKWTVLPGISARSVHAILLQNGKLLIMAGSGNSREEAEMHHFRSFIYDPVANTSREIPTPEDVFCSGHVQLTNGNVLILGGTKEYPPAPKPGEFPSTKYKGENASWIFNIHKEEYEEVKSAHASQFHESEPGPLLNGAWYPSATELGNGDVISFGGLNEQGNGAVQTNYYTDPANPAPPGDNPGEWVGFGSNIQQTFDWFWGLYPSMILTDDGRLFYDGSHVFGNGLDNEETGEPGVTKVAPNAPLGSSIYDFYCTPGKTQEEEEIEQGLLPKKGETNPNVIVKGPNGEFKRVTSTPGLREPDMRDQSASLLLPPAQAQKVMIMGGGNTYRTANNALDLTDEINLNESNPEWKPGPNLPQGEMESGGMEPMGAGKMYISAVALPDGTVFETGGSLRPRMDNVHEASIFSPQTNAFTPVAADPVGRNYHSEALLLPDGRVIALGSNPADPETGQESFETRISIYEPPYLFKGARPAINLIDGVANHLEGSVNHTAQWEWGATPTISYSSSEKIKSAVLVRPAAVTHSSDPNQREVALPIASGGEAGENKQLQVGLTSNPNLAPPGYYMVFLVNSKGVPSVAQWVHVGTPTT